ncbi:hypothetical protein APHAL10511_000300, partial [Amanita phalloides]
MPLSTASSASGCHPSSNCVGMLITDPEDLKNLVSFKFARLAACANAKRIKLFHIDGTPQDIEIC